MAKPSTDVNRRFTFPAGPLARLATQRRITENDVLVLRGSEVGLGLRSRDEAELMFTIERGAAEKCRAWEEFLVECLTDFVVWDERPSGALSEDAAQWLSDQVGEKPTPACLALLIAVLDEAQAVPAWFTPAVRLRASKVFGGPEAGRVQQAA